MVGQFTSRNRIGGLGAFKAGEQDYENTTVYSVTTELMQKVVYPTCVLFYEQLTAREKSIGVKIALCLISDAVRARFLAFRRKRRQGKREMKPIVDQSIARAYFQGN
jgi:hypothetical protein